MARFKAKVRIEIFIVPAKEKKGHVVSRVETWTPGIWGTPYLFGRMGAKKFELGSWELMQAHKSFTQIQAALPRNTLHSTCLVIVESGSLQWRVLP